MTIRQFKRMRMVGRPIFRQLQQAVVANRLTDDKPGNVLRRDGPHQGTPSQPQHINDKRRRKL
jgi:hypothetical protein